MGGCARACYYDSICSGTERNFLCTEGYRLIQFIVEQEGIEPSFCSVPRAVLRTVLPVLPHVGFVDCFCYGYGVPHHNSRQESQKVFHHFTLSAQYAADILPLAMLDACRALNDSRRFL